MTDQPGLPRGEMRIDTSEEHIRDLAIAAISQRTPLSVLRMGDGEMLVARGNGSRLRDFFERQLGFALSDEERVDAQDCMQRAVLRADVLGLPTEVHCKLHPLWSVLFDYYEGLRQAHPDEWGDKRYCSINCHLNMMRNGALSDVLRAASRVVVVSSRDVKDRLTARFTNITHVEQYSIPGEQVYEVEKNKGRDTLDLIHHIAQELRAKPRDGELLIFGAGFVGKRLGADFATAGGVALDIGSVFDFWVGKITRGPNKGAESYGEPAL